ncbi:MAG TPA: hypothetical protein VI197_14550 [Polyangiaceae bacterium]
MKLNNFQRLGLSVALCFSFAANACGSDDDNPSPGDDDVVTGGSSGNGGSGGSNGETTSGGSGGTGGTDTDAGGTGGSGGTVTTTAAGGGAGAPTSDGGAGGTTTTTTSTSGGGSGGTGLPECDEPTDEECFDLTACAPTRDAHVLNQCTESNCFAYDNAANLPLYNGGDLPPVP